MKPTNGDKLFFDTNVLLYLTSNDESKSCIASRVVETGGTISVQVLNEFVAVARRKLLLSWPAITAHLEPIRRACQIVPLTLHSHDHARNLAERYKVPIYDALIIASAIDAGCTLVMTEDFQHGQMFERCIRVCNPFAATV